MCGRYASSRDARDLASAFEVEEPPEEVIPPSWNVAPTDPVYAVLQRDDRRLLRVLRWGLVPSWAKDAKGAARLINARQETVTEKPAFRAAYQRRRCLLPADGYYEWQVEGTRKQPWFLTSREGEPLAMAGLYEVWCPGRAAPVDLHGHHDRGVRRARPHPRPHAAARPADGLGALAGPGRRGPGGAPAGAGASAARWTRGRWTGRSATCATTARSWCSRCEPDVLF